MSPTVPQFERSSRLYIWSMKYFLGGGGNHDTYVIEIPTNQTDLHNKQEVIDFAYGVYNYFHFCYLDTEKSLLRYFLK